MTDDENPVFASSAFRHREIEADVLHALRHPVHIHAVDEEDMTMVIGPARDARLLEVGIVRAHDGSIVVVHAMTGRPKNLKGW